jgi:hypothetical protein
VNIGEGGANIGFSRDGKTAFIALMGADAVAVIDVDKLTLISQIKAGKPAGARRVSMCPRGRLPITSARVTLRLRRSATFLESSRSSSPGFRTKAGAGGVVPPAVPAAGGPTPSSPRSLRSLHS